MKKFAKIFEVIHPGDKEVYQVLYTTTYDAEEDSYKLVMRTDLNDVECVMAAGFYEENRMREAFEASDQDSANKFFASITEQFKDTEL